MSLIKTIRQQLGLSVTPANNFTQDASADNGTMKLARGNAGATTQDILTVDAAGKVSFPQNTDVDFGIGQTWQDVTGSRAYDTTYTNSTNKPILVHVHISQTIANSRTTAYLEVGGMVISSCQVQGNSATGGENFMLTGVVPPGATYRVPTPTGAGGATLAYWKELR